MSHDGSSASAFSKAGASGKDRHFSSLVSMFLGKAAFLGRVNSWRDDWQTQLHLLSSLEQIRMLCLYPGQEVFPALTRNDRADSGNMIDSLAQLGRGQLNRSASTVMSVSL